jgi:TonB family protein
MVPLSEIRCAIIRLEDQQMRRSILLSVILAGGLFAADFSGRWAGTIEADRGRRPIYVTLSEHDGTVTGSVATGANARSVAIENAELRNGELSFQVHDNANRVMQFRLTLTDGVLGGEASVGGQVSKVAVVQAGGGVGMRIEPNGTIGGGSGGGMGIASGAASALPAGVNRVGGGVSAPQLIYKKDPDYTEEARKANYQGTVLLYAEITPDGRATNIKVQRSLGLGLDEKAIEAVSQWKFKPGYKNGVPVTVAATIEVNFRL